MCNIGARSDLAALLRLTGLIIWDEVPMQHKLCFEAVNRTLQDIRRCNKLFGGIPTLFGGDFAQILPVVKNGNRGQTVDACLQASPIWPHLRVLSLTENMRVRGQTNKINNLCSG